MAFRKYKLGDFLRIREFLSQSYHATGELLNWRIERWNWSRYHPMMFDPKLFQGSAEANTRFWEAAVGIWEDADGGIVGVVNVETPQYGEAWFQRWPGADALLPAMLDDAEAKLVDRDKGVLRCYVYEHDAPLQALLRERGYQKDGTHGYYDSEYVIDKAPAVELPQGYAVRSMAQGGDVALRCKVQGLGFNHPDPADWCTVLQYKRVQEAPDYRPDLDLYVRGPDGEYVSCCIVWYDARNRLGIFEPVCTHPDFRRQGLGRAVIMEGIRRVAALGAETAQVGSGQPFYGAIGFERKYVSYPWEKAF